MFTDNVEQQVNFFLSPTEPSLEGLSPLYEEPYNDNKMEATQHFPADEKNSHLRDKNNSTTNGAGNDKPSKQVSGGITPNILPKKKLW